MRHDTCNMNKNSKWILLIALTIVIAAPLILWKGRQFGTSIDKTPVSDTAPVAEHHETEPIPPAMHENVKSDEAKLDMEEIRDGQTKAAKAAIDAAPIEGDISQRPEFVSEIEWDVLKNAVAENGEKTGTLSHIVNKLLFFKKREAWMNVSIPLDTRKKLAGELLDMIPVQVEEMSIDQTFADKMSADLNAFLN